MQRTVRSWYPEFPQLLVQCSHSSAAQLGRNKEGDATTTCTDDPYCCQVGQPLLHDISEMKPFNTINNLSSIGRKKNPTTQQLQARKLSASYLPNLAWVTFRLQGTTISILKYLLKVYLQRLGAFLKVAHSTDGLGLFAGFTEAAMNHFVIAFPTTPVFGVLKP